MFMFFNIWKIFRKINLVYTNLEVLFDYVNLYFTVGFNVFLIYKFVTINTLWFMHPKSHQVSGLRQAFIAAEKQPLHKKKYDLNINNPLLPDIS
jgi:hypothetical protein